jgi:hypothetical protein
MSENEHNSQRQERGDRVHESCITEIPVPNEAQTFDLEKIQSSAPVAETNQVLFQVEWDENDFNNPKNWSPYLKLWMTFMMGLLAFTGSFGSAITNPAEEALVKHFNISPEVTVLAMSLFILGASSLLLHSLL